MRIVVDSREQNPIELGCETLRKGLSIGDYRGELDKNVFSRTVFERKSIGDLYGTLSKGYKRFKREIEKAADKKLKLVIIVEGTLTKVLGGYKRSKRDPISLVQQIFTIRARYGVETVFCSSRAEMAQYITCFFAAQKAKYLNSKREDAK